jgi:CheY-like chemotaxis protein
MNGRLWVESELRRGSRFCCTMQLQAAPSATAQSLELSDDGHQFSTRLRSPADRPLRILVAEDTPANQKVVQAILGRRGHTVVIVENGREAVDRLQKTHFDVVLMDAQMPTMNGLQATAAIRHIADSDRARVPIIAMTAHAMREDRQRCLAAGIDDYLAKPIDATELIRIVELYGSRGKALDTPRKQSPC